MLKKKNRKQGYWNRRGSGRPTRGFLLVIHSNRGLVSCTVAKK